MKVTFRRINGRVVPIKSKAALKAGVSAAAIGGGALVGSKVGTKRKGTHEGFKALSTGIAIGSGILSGLTFFSGHKAAIAGTAAGFGIDALSSASNLAAHRKIKDRKSRIKSIAGHELFNTALGWGAFGATLLASSKGRGYVLKGLKKVMGR